MIAVKLFLYFLIMWQLLHQIKNEKFCSSIILFYNLSEFNKKKNDLDITSDKKKRQYFSLKHAIVWLL